MEKSYFNTSDERQLFLCRQRSFGQHIPIFQMHMSFELAVSLVRINYSSDILTCKQKSLHYTWFMVA